jgi:hypothetical protein
MPWKLQKKGKNILCLNNKNLPAKIVLKQIHSFHLIIISQKLVINKTFHIF